MLLKYETFKSLQNLYVDFLNSSASSCKIFILLKLLSSLAMSEYSKSSLYQTKINESC